MNDAFECAAIMICNLLVNTQTGNIYCFYGLIWRHVLHPPPLPPFITDIQQPPSASGMPK